MPKLLIVDDHAGVRGMIRQLAALPETDVRECARGDEALAAAREFAPDIVTMDIRLPDANGIELTRALHRESNARRIIVVSAYDLPHLRAAAREAGAFAFVAKDNLGDLISVLAPGATTPRGRPLAGSPTASQEKK